METKTLIETVKTRMKLDESNPTRALFFREILKALERLEKYEQKDNSCDKK